MTLWSGYEADSGYTHAYAPTMAQSNAWPRLSSTDGTGKCACPLCRSDPALGAHLWEGETSSTTESTRIVPGCHSSAHLAAMLANGSRMYVRRDQCLLEHGEDSHLLFGGSHYINAGEFIQARSDYPQKQTVLAISGSPSQPLPAENLSVVSKSVEKFLEHISN